MGSELVTLLRFVVIVLAAGRLARLTTRDKITAGLREWVRDRLLFTPAQRRARVAGDRVPPPRSARWTRVRIWLLDLSSCDWCTTVWWAAALTVADVHCHRPGHRSHTLYQIVSVTLAASYAAGWLTQHEQPNPTVVIPTSPPDSHPATPHPRQGG